MMLAGTLLVTTPCSTQEEEEEEDEDEEENASCRAAADPHGYSGLLSISPCKSASL